MKISTTTLVGTTVLGALVVILDYSLKFSGLKIPFPLLPYLKFDFTGIPIVLSLLLFGLLPGATTSAVAFLAILVRSGDVVGSSMKALAEFSTIVGMTLALRWSTKTTRFTKAVALIFGATSRIATMFLANLAILPSYYGTPFVAAVFISPYVGAFNLVQGLVSMFGGFLVYEAIVRRAPSLLKTLNEIRNVEAD